MVAVAETQPEPSPTETEEQPFSRRLLERLDAAVATMRQRGGPRSWHPEDPQALRGWLTLLWQAMQASVPLLLSAREELRNRPRTPFTEGLGDYYRRHAIEERDHDEWLLEDLARLGVSADLTRQAFPSKALTAMVGSQYYLIHHYHPGVLLGYIAFCEAYPPSPEDVKNLIAKTATPPEAWRTYLHHGQEDPRHLKELCEVINQVPDTWPVLRPAVVLNALRSVSYYAEAFQSLCRNETPTREENS